MYPHLHPCAAVILNDGSRDYHVKMLGAVLGAFWILYAAINSDTTNRNVFSPALTIEFASIMCFCSLVLVHVWRISKWDSILAQINEEMLDLEERIKADDDEHRGAPSQRTE